MQGGLISPSVRFVFVSVLVSFCHSFAGGYGGKEKGEPRFDSHVVGDRTRFKGGKMGCCLRGQRYRKYETTHTHTPPAPLEAIVPVLSTRYEPVNACPDRGWKKRLATASLSLRRSA